MQKVKKVTFNSKDVTEDYKLFMKEIGIRLYVLRIERELSPTAVAKALGMNYFVFRLIERGEFNCMVDDIKKIRDYYATRPKKWDIFSKLLPHSTDPVFS